ncbi:MAG: methyltransferase [Alphaproteobacteria bacterium]|nr:methyltransferase [Alphaproteobacteria bacterium]
MTAPDIVSDKFLDGRLILAQPRHGYRAAMDPVLLAAAVPAVRPSEKVLELGCGVGTALFCYGTRVPDAHLTGLEIDADTADLARSNAAANGLSPRTSLQTGDILALPNGIAPGTYHQVFANPPYMTAGAGDASPVEGRARSNVEGAARLKDWIWALLKCARPKGGIALIHRADRVDEILSRLHGKAGDITVIPLWPRIGAPAKRVIVRARKGVRGGAILHPGLVLHGDGDTRYTDAASAILRNGAALT